MKKPTEYNVVDPANIRQSQSIAEEEKMQKKSKLALKSLKKKLLVYLFLISIFLLIIIFERVFAGPIMESENDFIAILQESFLIDDRNQHNFFFYIIGSLGSYRFFLLILIHIYCFLYFFIDSLMAIKIMTAHFIGLYIIYLLQLLYAVQRPYWADSKIVSYFCDGSFILPDDFTFSLVFMLFYGFFCFENRLERTQSLVLDRNDSAISQTIIESEALLRKKFQVCKIVFWVICSVILIIRYLIGILYLDSIFMSFLYAMIFYFIFRFGESYFDDLIKRSVVEKNSAKRLLFYWLVILILLQCLAIILYLTNDPYISIEYITNYTVCIDTQGFFEDNPKLIVNSSIGNWFTFIGSSVIIVLLGGLFGSFLNNVKMLNLNWFEGNNKQKLARIAISTIVLVPSWILQYYLPYIISINLVSSLVINEFFLNMLHLTLIVYLQFGIFPYYIFKKLKLVNDNIHGYKIVG